MKEKIEKNSFALTEEQQKIEKNLKDSLKSIEKIKETLEEKNFFEEDSVKITSLLRKKYPDAEKYYLYHLVAGSTPSPEKSLYFDFPGEDSIYEILRKLLKNLLSKL
jgi:lysyl-tRNA synthetase class I